MSFGSAAAIYLTIWWVVLFAILPLRVRSLHEEGDVPPGHDAGAPGRPRLLWKAGITTLVSLVVFAIVYAMADAFD